jgi:hypothetical protein
MALDGAAAKNNLADRFGDDATYGALFTTAPSGGSAGTEVTGGSPAYARKALTWTAGATGVATASATFDVPACTVVGTGVYTASTGGTYLSGNTVTSAIFSTQDTVTVNFTITIS